MHGMADKDKSREVRKPIIEVGDCEQDVYCGTGECDKSTERNPYEVYDELRKAIQKYRGDWFGLEYDKIDDIITFYVNNNVYQFRLIDESENDSDSSSELTIKIQADVKDALKGFKALQRELRETTKAARELEQAYKDAEKVVNSGVINVMDKDRRLLASIGREDIITNNDIIVEIDGEKVGKAVYPTTFDLQTSALKQAVEESNQIPDKLRKDILAKFAEDEAKIAELECKLND